jgi:hypothetical protein
VSGTLIPTLQVAIGPVILISGIGLLLLSMTNRFGRTVDRTRELARESRTMPEDRSRIEAQLQVLMYRARIMRTAIAAASVSVLCAALLIIVLFIGALLQVSITAAVVGTLFIVCMICLIASLLLFISDVNLSLKALKVEISATMNDER